jgi:hypothetical protein
VHVVCRESSESELPFQSAEVPSASASAPRTPSFNEGDLSRLNPPRHSHQGQTGLCLSAQVP